MFEAPAIRAALPLLVLKKLCLIMIAAYLAIGLTAGYRAYHQMKSVELEAPPELRVGSSIETSVITYGRTFVDLRLELIQGQQSKVLSAHRIANNRWAFMDPRTRRVTQSTVLTADNLEKLQSGPAILRATVTGRRQLGHVPPPLTREVTIDIDRP